MFANIAARIQTDGTDRQTDRYWAARENRQATHAQTLLAQRGYPGSSPPKPHFGLRFKGNASPFIINVVKYLAAHIDADRLDIQYTLNLALPIEKYSIHVITGCRRRRSDSIMLKSRSCASQG